MSKKSKILMTGGHAGSTAFAVIEEIASQGKNWDIYWIGVKNAFEGGKQETFEQKVFPKMGVRIINITTGRLQRRWSIYTVPSLLKIPLGILQSFFVLVRLRPRVVLSFGGFAAVPVVIAAFILRVPVVLHEQTAAVGLANRLSAVLANRIAIARTSSKRYFPKSKVVLVGNPLRMDVLDAKSEKKRSRRPRILVTGGSRGAKRMNDMFAEDMENILERFEVVHQAGGGDYAKFLERRKKLSGALKGRYEVYDFLDTKQMAREMASADVVVSRAGANTVSELLYLGKRMVLIPIPWTRYNEQVLNANLARQYAKAVVLDQETVGTGGLCDGIVRAMGIDLRKIRRDTAELDAGAAGRMVGLLDRYA